MSADLVPEREVARILGLGASTLRSRRLRGTEGVPWVRLPSGSVAYYRSALPDTNRADWICQADAAQILGLTPEALTHRRNRGVAGVPWRKTGGRIWYRRCDLGKMAPRPGHKHTRRGVAAYSTVHQRIGRCYGPAKAWPCATPGCDQTAAHWAYLEGCPDELADADGRNAGLAYCEHPECYRALCPGCHAEETGKAS